MKLPSDARWAELETAATARIDTFADFEAWRLRFGESHLGLDALAAALAEEGLARRFFDAILPELLASVPRLARFCRTSARELRALKIGEARTLVLPRARVFDLLACSLLGVLPTRGDPTFPKTSFSALLAHGKGQIVAKLRCLLAYFDRAVGQMPSGVLEIERCVLDPQRMQEDWAANERPLLPLEVRVSGVIEDAQRCLQVDFANRYIGGGVLGGGCVQEELRFAVCPELLVSLLCCQVLDDHEALRLRGSEQFSTTRGYGFSARFAAPYDDPCARRRDGTPQTDVVAIDAIPFRGGSSAREQLAARPFLREVNKAYCGFSGGGKDSDARPVASGNWGCGVFNGHHQVKAIAQWIAASAAGRILKYYSFGDERVGELGAFADRVLAAPAPVTVGALWRAARRIAERPDEDGELYERIEWCLVA